MLDAMSPPICHGYQCNSIDLIEAHIYARGFARDMMEDHTHNLKITLDKVQATQHGVFDPGILCATCDGTLGKLDDYALEVYRRFPREHIRTRDGGFEMPNIDGDRFATFLLSLLWHAAITSRVEFRKVSLGPYETAASEVIFGARPLRSLPAYQLLIGRNVPGGLNFNPERNYTSPARLKIAERNGYAFALHGFRVIAKLDGRPLPPMFRISSVNGSTKLNGPFIPFHSTPEGKAMVEMKKAELVRSMRRSSGRP
ncbi:MAG: hypothetical protein WA459_02155 [Stellaceae bacterium]